MPNVYMLVQKYYLLKSIIKYHKVLHNLQICKLFRDMIYNSEWFWT
jgi:hypothetical protein